MNKFIRSLLCVGMFAVLAGILTPTPVMAGGVFNRVTNTVAGATWVWTNTYRYAAVEVKKVWISQCSVTSTTMTVTRIVPGVYSNTCATVALTTTSYGEGVPANYMGLKFGDILSSACSPTNTAIQGLEFEVQ